MDSSLGRLVACPVQVCYNHPSPLLSKGDRHGLPDARPSSSDESNFVLELLHTCHLTTLFLGVDYVSFSRRELYRR